MPGYFRSNLAAKAPSPPSHVINSENIAQTRVDLIYDGFKMNDGGCNPF